MHALHSFPLGYYVVWLSQDLRKARELFLKSAEKGSSDGQYYLGKMYFGKYVHIMLIQAQGCI